MTYARGRSVARFGLWLGLIAFAALGLRVGYVALAKTGDDVCGDPLCGDAFYYSLQAASIADGNGFDQVFARVSPPPTTRR